MLKLCSLAAVFSLLLHLVVPAFGQMPASQSTQSRDEIERRVETLLKGMTLEEKIDMIGGVDEFFIRGFERLGVPRMRMADGPVGVRNFGPATAMAGGIALAASWNTTLAERMGVELGRDARAKGVHFLLGPGVNIYRAPMNGRNFEYFGEDPFLASRIAVGYIKGVQSQGVSATVKHFIGNNSEFDRHNTDSIIDERAMREIYLPAFEAAVKEANVGAVMDAYNLTNGAHMTENAYLNTDVLRKQWNFKGIMMSDWVATYDGVAAANSGLDLEMPSGKFMNRANLLPAIEAGKVSRETIDEKVRRIIRTAARFGWLDREQIDRSVPRLNPQGREVALEAARESMTLLKNEGNLLPLAKERIKSIAIIGPNAHPAVPVGGGSAQVVPFASTSFLMGLNNYLGASGAKIYFARGLPVFSEMAEATDYTTSEAGGQAGLRAEYFKTLDFQGAPATTRVEPHINFGRQFRSFPEGTLSSRWSGYYHVTKAGEYKIFATSTGEDGGFYRLYVDDKLVLNDWLASKALVDQTTLTLDAEAHKIVLEQHAKAGGRLGTRMQLVITAREQMVDAEAKKLAAMADVIIVAAGFEPGVEAEGADRTFGLPVGQDELIEDIVAANKKTIVALTSGGGADMSAWLERVPALIETWYPGQEGGTALAEILFGEVNPSGRLPVTFERRFEDNPVHDSYYTEAGTNRIVYKEGVFVGYRGYEHNNTKPLFPFGFGLSYTTFKYSDLVTKPVSSKAASVAPSLQTYEVSFNVKNTGNRAGADVAQVYVGDSHAKVARPVKELKGFVKVNLRAGESRRVSVRLDARAFSYYDVNAKSWRADAGDFDILVGRSSEQIDLRGKLKLDSALTLAP